MLCTQCGKEIPDSAVNCAYCGASTTASSTQEQPVVIASSVQAIIPARKGTRFFTLFGDWFFMQVIIFFISIAGGTASILGIYAYNGSLLRDWLIIPFLYYFISEVLWAKSPAKFLTQTRVVTQTGAKPTPSQIAIRSLARCIPFEPLSFLFTARPVGWHDRLSQTVVIEDK